MKYLLLLKEVQGMEHSERLAKSGHLFFYDDALFHPSTDTFLLSAFPRLRAEQRVCDLGCGNGLLGLLLLRRQPQLQVTGVEILPRAVALAEKAIQINGLGTQMRICSGDLRNVRRILPAGSFDLVVCNPPYYAGGTGWLPDDAAMQAARAELFCTPEDVCAAAEWLLHWGGSLCLVHKPERLTDLLCSLRSHALEPKRLRMVCKTPLAAPSLILLEGRRGGKPGLTVEPPLILQQPDGSPTAELDAIYFRQQEDMP
jgi:tRNA1Val (adenine37-N6)-methyltransferase